MEGLSVSHPVEGSIPSVHKDPQDLVAVLTLGRGRRSGRRGDESVKGCWCCAGAAQRLFCGAMDQGFDHHRDAALGGMLVY